MITWLLVIILSYLFFGLSSLGDKLVLNNSNNPKLYVFYVGILNLIVILLIPFFGLYLPNSENFFWIILTSFSFIAGLYFLYYTVNKFEVSKVIPIVGAIQPILVLLLSWFLLGYGIINFNNLIAFLILLIGSVIISFEEKIKFTGLLLKLSLIASFLMALVFVFTKFVFLNQSFVNGIIWIGIFNFLFGSIYFFDKSVRKEFFVKKNNNYKNKTIYLVLFAQLTGGLAGILQNFAIYLAPASSLAILNALRGVQYVFLFIIILIFSKFLPNILKEEISRKLVIQKTTAIILIVIGLAFLIIS